LQEIKKLKLLYGGISKFFFKKSVKFILNAKYKKTYFLFLNIFEKRLDVILYRSKFSPSIRNARQLILHGIILVNNIVTKIKSFKLNPGDFISINFKYHQ
jgi:small subunit ribosomal protein S4